MRRMHLYDVVLFLHIATLLAAIGLATTLHHAEWSTRKLQPWASCGPSLRFTDAATYSRS